jgi:SMC interacting uncharacterized protein involved in chromosome segregation
MTANYAELDRLQQQCNSIRTEMSGGLLAIEQRLQSLRNEHEKRTSDVEKFRRDCSDAIAHNLEDIIACECESFSFYFQTACFYARIWLML